MFLCHKIGVIAEGGAISCEVRSKFRGDSHLLLRHLRSERAQKLNITRVLLSNIPCILLCLPFVRLA